ncbi:MAG: ComF family protein [Betaproteobacteria bacterium]|nr:ComF family protein [Betaproteobacteria bacterium]
MNDRFSFARFLPPQDCALCAAPSGDAAVCRQCADELPVLAPACPICALPQPDRAVCGACLRDPPQYDATISAFRYDFPLDRLVRALKFHGQLELARFLGEQLVCAVAGRSGATFPVLIPMPLHRRRLAERGFNQAVELGRHIARITGAHLETAAALRIIDTASQTALPVGKREQNIRGAFRCNADLTGQTVAIIDDVMTTGSTLNEFARVLKKAGAGRVENWVVARTVRDA